MEADFEFKMNIGFSIFQENYIKKLRTTSDAIDKDAEDRRIMLNEMDHQCAYNQKYWFIEALTRENAWKS